MNYILDVQDIVKAKKQLEQIESSSQGVELMSAKMLHLNVKLKNVKLGAANILKQEMLSIGAEAAVARGVVDGKALISDVILCGSIDKFRKLVKKLNHQAIFGLGEIQSTLIKFINIMLKEDRQLILENEQVLDLRPVKIMGILNCTPDSFSDGDKYLKPEIALEHCLSMIEEGADFIDLGGESSRPGIDPISESEEISRIRPVLKLIRANTSIPLSIDTYHAKTAQIVLEEGADIVNDISALTFDKQMIKLLASYKKVPVILMHMLGNPKNMQENPRYEHVIEDILNFFEERIAFCQLNGIDRSRIILDPGIGFGKSFQDNLLILNNLKSFKSFDLPLLLGASRKSFINNIYTASAQERLSGTLATSSLAFNNDINIIRVHDVKENKRFIDTLRHVSLAL